MDKYILTEAEYKALDKAMMKSLLEDDGQSLYQFGGADYYACQDKDYVHGYNYTEIADADGTLFIVPILEYLPELDNAFCDFVDCYEFDGADIMAYDGLCKKAGCFTASCEYR